MMEVPRIPATPIIVDNIDKLVDLLASSISDCIQTKLPP